MREGGREGSVCVCVCVWPHTGREGGRECVCVLGSSLVVCKARHLKGLAWARGVTDRHQGKVKGPLELRE